jgi:hypothetical protein
MTLNQYLDVAYATLVDEYRRLGANLTEALERTREYAAGFTEISTAGGKTQGSVAPSQDVENHEAQNEMALVQLEAMMAGVGGLGR